MILQVNYVYFLVSSIFLVFLFWSCEEEFIFLVIDVEEQIVIEGYIEGGDCFILFYVFLICSFVFFSELSQEDLNNVFVCDVEVIVSDGIIMVEFIELCLEDVLEEFCV